MNERIKELEEQCTEQLIDYDVGKRYDQVDHRKLAELIVKECAEFIAPMGDYCGGHGEPSAPSSRECARRLKQHFGVEE